MGLRCDKCGQDNAVTIVCIKCRRRLCPDCWQPVTVASPQCGDCVREFIERLNEAVCPEGAHE